MPSDPFSKSAPDISRTAQRLSSAVTAIDAQFGQGYARDHPDLVASLVQSATIDAAVATGMEAHAQALQLASDLGQQGCETLLKLKPRIFG